MRVSQICFSEARIFDKIGFGRQKPAWGCRAEVVLKMTFFTFFPGEDQFVKFLVRVCVAFWVQVGLVAKNGLAAAVRRVSGLFFRHRLREFADDLLKLPSSSCHVLLFSAFSFLGLGSAQPCMCVLGSRPSTLVLFGFLQKHCFLAEKGLFLFASLCLAFFLLGFVHFSFSLSLSLVSCFFLPSCFIF